MTSLDFKELMKRERKKAFNKRRQKEQDTNINKISSSSSTTTSFTNNNNNNNNNNKLINNTHSSITNQQQQQLLQNIDKYKCPSTISNIYYIPNFITIEEEETLIKDIEQNAKLNKPWISLTQRRLMNMGGIPHSTGMLKEILPDFIKKLNNKLLEQGIVMKKQDKNNNLKQYIPSKVPNHVLLNEYTNGKGISPHQDGPLYDSNAIILSLNSSARIDFLTKEQDIHTTTNNNNEQEENISMNTKQQQQQRYNKMESVLLMPRSLLIFNKDAYNKYYHGIKTTQLDMINLLEKTICNKIFLPKELFLLNMNNNNASSIYIPRNVKRLSITLRHAKLKPKSILTTTTMMKQRMDVQEEEEDDDDDCIILNQEAMNELKRREIIWYKNICENKNDIEQYVW